MAEEIHLMEIKTVKHQHTYGTRAVVGYKHTLVRLRHLFSIFN